MPGSENLTTVMFTYIYVLSSTKDKSKLYIGLTQNLVKRVNEHNRKHTFSTRPYAPWKVIHYEAYIHKQDAIRREKYLKTNQGSRLLKRMLKEYFYSTYAN
jgi:putative endonuclease